MPVPCPLRPPIRHLTALVVLPLLSGWASTQTADAEPPFVPYRNAPVFLAQVDHEIDLVYKEAHGVELRLDLYRPKDYDATTAGPLPVLVNFHGGGFRLGSKFGFATNTFLGDTFLPLLTSGRLAVVSVNYRFVDERTTLLDIVGDCFDALRWIRAEGPALGLDPERVIVMGHSAGGYLALMLGVAPPDAFPADRAGDSARVVATLAVSPPTDFTRLERERADLFGRPRGEAPERYALGSPLHHVRADLPSTLVVCGDQDRLHEHAEAFVDAAQAAGAPATLLTVKGGIHALYQARETWQPDRTTFSRMLREFVARHHASPPADQ